MKKYTAIFAILNLSVYFFECAFVQAKTLDPIYWNSSNPLFRTISRRHYHVNAAINDKLDLICPRKDKGDGEELFYFKLYLVSEENFRQCNAFNGSRLLTCDVPRKEKKYTFFFQEISPSPWGLEFEPGKSYYVISTSDGSQSGMDRLKGGVCTRFSMKIELRIQSKDDSSVNLQPPQQGPNPPGNNVPPISNPIQPDHPGQKSTFVDSHPKKDFYDEGDSQPSNAEQDALPSPKNPPTDQVSGNGLIIGIVLGACAVLFVLLVVLIGYRVHKKRRRHKKFHTPPPISPRDPQNMQEVTLLRIASPHHTRLHSDDRHRAATLTAHADMRPPPSYNESFLDNGGPVVAV